MEGAEEEEGFSTATLYLQYRELGSVGMVFGLLRSRYDTSVGRDSRLISWAASRNPNPPSHYNSANTKGIGPFRPPVRYV